jgi:hypothetical protein
MWIGLPDVAQPLTNPATTNKQAVIKARLFVFIVFPFATIFLMKFSTG